MKNGLKMALFHGTSRTSDVSTLADNDIVITTYTMLAQPILAKVNWHRIVLDEAQSIKNPKSAQSRAAANLRSNRRWAVTGTPVGSNLNDLEGLLKFLKFSPLDSHEPFGKFVFSGGVETLLALKHISIRHTKAMTERGSKLIELPPLHEQDIAVELSTDERKTYSMLHRVARKEYRKLKGDRQSWVEIMALLSPLRTFCSGCMVKASSQLGDGASSGDEDDGNKGMLDSERSSQKAPDNETVTLLVMAY